MSDNQNEIHSAKTWNPSIEHKVSEIMAQQKICTFAQMTDYNLQHSYTWV